MLTFVFYSADGTLVDYFEHSFDSIDSSETLFDILSPLIDKYKPVSLLVYYQGRLCSFRKF